MTQLIGSRWISLLYSSRSVSQLVHALGGATEEEGAVRRREALGQSLVGIPEHRITHGNLVDGEVAFEHAASSSKSFNRVQYEGLDEFGQLLRVGQAPRVPVAGPEQGSLSVRLDGRCEGVLLSAVGRREVFAFR